MLFRSIGDFQNAFETQAKLVSLKDSLLNNETARKLEQLRTQYEVDKAITAEKVKQDSLLAEQKFLLAPYLIQSPDAYPPHPQNAIRTKDRDDRNPY